MIHAPNSTNPPFMMPLNFLPKELFSNCVSFQFLLSHNVPKIIHWSLGFWHVQDENTSVFCCCFFYNINLSTMFLKGPALNPESGHSCVLVARVVLSQSFSPSSSVIVLTADSLWDQKLVLLYSASNLRVWQRGWMDGIFYTEEDLNGEDKKGVI